MGPNGHGEILASCLPRSKAFNLMRLSFAMYASNRTFSSGDSFWASEPVAATTSLSKLDRETTVGLSQVR